MITLTNKQFNKLAKVIATAARLSEVKQFEGYVPSAVTSKRKRMLRAQLGKLTDQATTKKDEETTVNIRVEIPEGGKAEKKEKSFKLNVGNLLKGRFNEVEVDDDDDIMNIVKGLFPKEHNSILGGKVVTEL